MEANQDNAEWISQDFEQDAADGDWKEYQSELQVVKNELTISGGMVASTEDLPQLILDDGGLNITDASKAGNINISDITYSSKFADISAEIGTPGNIYFKPNGLKMYALDYTGDNVYQYTLSTAWDISTVTYDSVSFYVGTQESAALGMTFSTDGTAMYVAGNTTDSVYQYTLTIPWDISSASYASKSLNITAQDTSIGEITFNDTGTIFYYLGYAGDKVYQYTLSTAWDISSASYASKSVSVGTQDSSPSGISFNLDGTKMYIIGYSSSKIHEYNLLTAWDISTALYTSSSITLSESSTPHGMFINHAIGSIYIVYGTSDTVYQYTTSISPSVFSDDISTATYDNKSFDFSTQETSVIAANISNDGLIMYLLGTINDTIYQYTLSTAWDVSTATYASKSFLANSQDTVPLDFHLGNDGTKLYIVGNINDSVYQYTLSTAWDISTASYDSVSYNASSHEDTPYSLTFSVDGSKMYIGGAASNSVYQYTLATPWDLSTTSYSNKVSSFGGQESDPTSAVFSSNGDRLWVVGYVTDTVYQYTLSTPWDISTVSYDSVSFSINSEDIYPYSLVFKSDGSKFYMLGNGTNSIYQYSASVSFFNYYKYDVGSATAAYKVPTTQMYTLMTSSANVLNMLDEYVDVVSASAGSVVLGYDNNIDQVFSQYDYVSTRSTETGNISGLVYDSLSYDPAELGAIFGLELSPDGTKMYAQTSGNAIYQYTLSTAWDVSSASYDSKSLNTASQTSTSWGISFNPDGNILYVNSYNTTYVYQYTLSTAWDISTATYASKSLNYNGQDSVGGVLRFDTTGTKAYLTGFSNAIIYQYTLSTAWDISTATYDSVSYAVTGQMTASDFMAVYFINDGSNMLATSGTTVFQYTLSTAWDISTTSYDSVSYNFNTQDSIGPYSLTLSETYQKLYIGCASPTSIHQYTLPVTTLDPVTTQINSVSVSASQTTLNFTDTSIEPTQVKINGRSDLQAPTSYELSGANDIVGKSDVITLPQSKRNAKIKIVGNTGDEVTAAKLNLWKV